VNTREPYERRLDRARTEPAPTSQPGEEAVKAVEALAVHRDPSVPSPTAKQTSDRSRPSVAWVRPSEIPTLLGSSVVRRGIDLQSELTRRARRAPAATASRAASRIARTSIANPEPPSRTSTTLEGLGL
jgi:hypothetical protein